MQYFKQIGNNHQSNIVTFTSRANPVKPFIMKTTKGNLYFEEPSMDIINSRGYVSKLTRFFCRNFASLTNDPYWKPFGEANLSKKYQKYFQKNVKYFKQILSRPDDDITLLVATDKENSGCNIILWI